MAATRRPPGTAPYRTGRNRVDVQREQLMSVYLGVSGRLCGSAPPSQPGAAVAWRSSEDPVKNAGWFTQARPSGAVTAAPPFGGIRERPHRTLRVPAVRLGACPKRFPSVLPRDIGSTSSRSTYPRTNCGGSVARYPSSRRSSKCYPLLVRNHDRCLRRRMRSSMPSGPSDT